MASGNDRRAKVLIVDADRERAAVIGERLVFLDYDPIIVEPGQPVPESFGIAAVVGTADEEVSTTAGELRRSNPGLPFLCLDRTSAPSGGPNWPLELPLTRGQLNRLLGRAERYCGRERRQRITGTSHPIRRVRRLIEEVADFDTTVLVTGQSGTGKELVARTIHELSDRADKPFVPINCGAIPAELLESELFGHEKGAFTGAISTRKGRFELAEGGTLFLDEIGEMSLDMQVKLLRVLQERQYERIGSNRLKECDVRIITATHVDLPQAVASGDFREDLFYRLNVFPIEMPPLYRRVSDLPQLLEELLLEQTGGNKGALRVSAEAMSALAAYPWPGNIRELSNLVERLVIMKPEGTIDLHDLPPKYRAVTDDRLTAADNCVAEAFRMTEANLKAHLEALEQQLIGEAMQMSDGVVAKAARLLSMRRTTLVEKIGKYQISH